MNSSNQFWSHTFCIIAAYSILWQMVATREIWEQHQSIFQSILSGDPDTAEMLTKQHTVEAETSMGWYRDEIS